MAMKVISDWGDECDDTFSDDRRASTSVEVDLSDGLLLFSVVPTSP
jgi:hypothetical protein